MSIKIKLAKLSLLLALLGGAVAAVPVQATTMAASDTTVLALSDTDLTPMGECSGGVGCST